MKEEKKTIRLYLDNTLYEKLEKFRKAERRSMNQTCCLLVEKKLKELGYK